MALMADTAMANNNVSSRDELLRKTGTIEASVVAWVAEAKQLYKDVDSGDKATILALLDDLRTKLTAATAI